MTTEPAPITLKAIGTVRSEIKEPTHKKYPDLISEIVIDKDLMEALDGLDDFSHIIVLWWIHQTRRPAPLKVHPRGNPENKLMGVLATRSPDRPNPIGKSTVRLVERRGNVLKVQGLDAIDGTPVLDIKPYIPGYDSADNATAPPWAVKK
ncbi:MAG: tRNA (N6-threonylcarbamoyladenosine(37)-N6)-methyltransferase TrmO [Chloroflexi bacterium RBG_13_57_8]|nr:MAG: tRNA (N6-threonylcarbamoyladenosine(37)-N6)-methyltransferase TrmO [Chloroflexi bacterium RBG_13_57_8]